MKIQPLGDRVLIEPHKQVGGKLKSGLYLPETADKERPEQGTVVAVGPGKWDEDGKKRIALAVKKGDKVLFTKYGPNEIKVDDKEYLIAREEDILAIIGGGVEQRENTQYRPEMFSKKPKNIGL